MKQDPRYWATAFINKFHTKRVGGSAMLKYLSKKFNEYGLAQYNHGYEDGRESQKKMWKRGHKIGYGTGYGIGYNDALKEKSYYQKGKIEEAYRSGYKDGYERNPSGITKKDVFTAFGINESTFYRRMELWGDLKRALTQPVRKRVRKVDMESIE
jgi:hypothetical protein